MTAADFPPDPRWSLPRRRVLGGAALAAAALSVPGAWARPSVSAAATRASGRFDRPSTDYTKATTLGTATPESMGLDGEALRRGWDTIAGFTAPPPEAEYPLYPGAVLLCGYQGKIVGHWATGFSRRYADGTNELPRSEWIETAPDTIYDLASVSKLFTSIVSVQLIEAGLVELEAPVVRYLPEFAPEGKEAVTVKMLLTHTSGFTSWLPLYSRYPDRESRIRAVMDAPLANPPGSKYLYSDLNLITLGVLAERLTGKGLDVLVAERITEPLGMVDTGYRPPAAKRQRIAATEYQSTPARGMVWGEVHDENAWSLAGVAGHAGVFGTARDLAVLAQALLNGGIYGGKRILSEESVEQLIANYTPEFPGNDHGLGFELNQRWYMGGLSSPRTAGHTGYTGTSLVVDYLSGSFVVLLSNRVHPSRTWGSVNPARLAAANAMAEALRVLPASGRDRWQADQTFSATSTLDLVAPASATRLTFLMLIDVEPEDPFSLLTSLDNGLTWVGLDYRLNGRQIVGPLAERGRRKWMVGRAELPQRGPGQSLQVRFAQTRDHRYSGRGLFLDGIQLRDDNSRLVLDTEADPGQFTAVGWALASGR